MTNRPRAFAVLGLSLAVCGLGALVIGARGTTDTTTDTRSAASLPSTSPAPGLRAFVDPESGGLHEPSAEEMRNAAASTTPLRKGANVQIVEHSNGMKSMVLDETFMATSVARIGDDGKLVTECLTDPAQVDRFLDGKPVEQPCTASKADAPDESLEVR